MLKRGLRLASIALVFSTLLTITACKGDDGQTTEVNAGQTHQVTETTVGDIVTSSPSNDETSAVITDTTEGDSEVNTPSKPTTKAEIVAYFNAAANKVKIDKPGYDLMVTNIIGDITSSNSIIESLASRIVPMFPQDPAPGKGASKGESHNNFPAKGQSWASKLSASAVSQAQCIEKEKYYEIKITLAEEALADLPKNPAATKHGSVMNVLSADEIYEQTDKFKFIANVKYFAPTFSGSYITCIIEKDTGNMKSAVYYCSTIASVKAKPILGSEITATVPFAIKEEYSVKY
ncbi:MAG: hypothetical protein GX824_06950 [Clostridiales bacterium]|jgi:hypothetical protein|nr:hypothetical protein [Clostridiales bacterium]